MKACCHACEKYVSANAEVTAVIIVVPVPDSPAIVSHQVRWCCWWAVVTLLFIIVPLSDACVVEGVVVGAVT
jgi:hypothetical protein